MFQTQVVAFNGGDGWYLLAVPCESLEDDDAQDRLDVLFALLETLKVEPELVKIGSMIRWRRREIEGWIAAGCPARERWEIISGEV